MKSKNLTIFRIKSIFFSLLIISSLFGSTGRAAFAQNTGKTGDNKGDNNKGAASSTGKRPLIIIPGITGSQIISTKTNKPVWFTFNFSRDEEDDLRLPMSTNFRQDTDTLAASDIIREVKLPGILKILPEIGVYGDALKAIEDKGYTEGDWNNPKAEDVYYVFAYDWRRDNVENAQLLISKIEALKAGLKRPDLKFNLIAHSMGGLIARYAAMYGKADLSVSKRAPRPTWAGAKHINKILLFGTPNEGSFSAFEVLTKGYSIAGRKLPFVRDLSPEDVFSVPSVYQLLPTNSASTFLNENLKPIQIDLYSPANWIKYNWGAIGSQKFLGKLKDAATIPGVKPDDWKPKNVDDKILADTTYAQAKAFLTAALSRAQIFHQALDVSIRKAPVEIYAYGSECAPTLNAVVLKYDEKNKEWDTITGAEKIKNSNGTEFSKEEVAKAIYADGDGRVTRRSFLSEIKSPVKTGKTVAQTIFPIKSSFFFCSEHQKLLSDQTIQTNYLTALAAEAAASNVLK
ncbi:MAG: esterase/lipase family protein [Pyrinomonadaceae bacterium]